MSTGMEEGAGKRKLSQTPEKPPAKKANQDSDQAELSGAIEASIVKSLSDVSLVDDISKRILNQVIDALKPHISKCVQEAVGKELNSVKELVDQNAVVQLEKRVKQLERKVEEQEQYTRRNCLRFSNIPFKKEDGSPAESAYDIKSDKIIMDICTDKLGVAVTEADISRSHVVGEPRDGKCQLIVRFISYRMRCKVYSAKSKLKDNSDKIFIVEDLTKQRYKIVQHLAALRYSKKISQYWTVDGRIFMKVTDEDAKVLVKSIDDVNQNLTDVIA